MAQDNDLSSIAQVNERTLLLAPTADNNQPRVALHQSQTLSPTLCASTLERENSGFSV